MLMRAAASEKRPVDPDLSAGRQPARSPAGLTCRQAIYGGEVRPTIVPTLRSALRGPPIGRAWLFRRLGPVIAIALTAATMQTARADSDADKAVIVQRLQRWTAAF